MMDPRVAELIEAANGYLVTYDNKDKQPGWVKRIIPARKRLSRAIAAFDDAKPDGGRMTTQAIGEPE